MRIDLPRIPGYRILAQLGAGSSGTVYRALQSDLGRQVALKILAPGLFDAEETRARFLREARLQARLAHGNLVALFDAGIVGEQAYLATEYVDGGTLRRLLGRPAALPLQHALRLAQEIAAGLTHAHEAGIVHRDLKPENVLLTAGGTAKVADFGLARSMEGNQTLKTAADRIMGTPGYLAPEVLCGATATCAADLYALGVILFEMFAGRKPFVGQEPRAMLEQSLQGETLELRSVRPEVPEPLGWLVTSCLALAPGGRPASARVVLEGLGDPELLATRCREASSGPREPDTSRLRVSLGDGQTTAPMKTVRPGPRREPPTAAATVACSSPRLPATTDTATRRRRLTAWLAVGLLAVLSLGFLALRPTARPPPSPTAGPHGTSATSPQPVPAAAAAKLPQVLRVTVGSTTARIWFREPVGPGVAVEYRTPGQPGATRQTVTPGAVVHRLSGLTPLTTSTISLLAGAERRGLKVATLDSTTHRGGLILERTLLRFRPSHLSAARGRGRIAAAWVRDPKVPRGLIRTVFRESPDDGETWGDLETVLETPPAPIRSSLAATADGYVVSLHRTGPNGVTVWLYFRAWDADRWRLLGQLELQTWCEARAVSSRDHGVDLVFAAKDGVRWIRAATAQTPFALRMDQGQGGVEGLWSRPWRSGKSLVFLHSRWPPDMDKLRAECAVVSGPASEAAAGVPPEAVTEPTEHAARMAAVTTPKRAVLLYSPNDNEAFVRQSTDGVRFTRARPLELPGGISAKTPACAAVGDDVYAVFQGISGLALRLVVLRCRAGQDDWEPFANIPLHLPDTSDLEAVPTSKDLLILVSDRLGGIVSLRIPLVQEGKAAPGRTGP